MNRIIKYCISALLFIIVLFPVLSTKAQVSLKYATSPDINTAVYSGTLYSVATEDGNPVGMAFSNDGLKMFMTGNDGDDVNEYALSTAFDISTASYTTSFSIASEDTNPHDITFNNDGTKLFVIGVDGVDVIEYALSIPFDVSTAGFTTTFSVATQDSSPFGLEFNNDGSKMYVVGWDGDEIHEYALSTSFDVSTASITTSFSVSAQETSPTGICFNEDGSKMYITGWAGQDVNEYALSTAFDISTASFTDNFSIATEETFPVSITFKNDGTEMFIIGSSDAVYAYNLSHYAFREKTTDFGAVNGSIIVSIYNDTFVNQGGSLSDPTHYTLDNLPSGLTPSMEVSPDGLTATLTLSGNATDNEDNDDLEDLQFSFTDDAFTASNAMDVTNAVNASSNLGIDFNDNPFLTYSTQIDLSTAVFSGTSFSVATEDSAPFGITFNNKGTKMYIVGANGKDINEYSLTTAFDINTASFTTNFSVAGEEGIPTGVTFNNDGTKMFVVGSSGDKVNEYVLDTAFSINTSTFSTSFSIAGLESVPTGLDFNNDGTKLYVIGEDGDDINEFSLSTSFDISSASYSTTYSIASEESEPMDLAFSPDGSKMFVIGASGDNVYEYSLGTAFNINSSSYTGSFSVSNEETNPQGLCFNNSGTKLFVVGWDAVNVSVYDLSDVAFSESPANNGAVNGSLIISIHDEIFTNAGSSLNMSTHFTITNLPAGLTPDLSVSSDALTATLTFTGNADPNENTEDLNNLQFSFTDAAFANYSTTDIINATGPANSNLGMDFEDNPPPELIYATSANNIQLSFSGTTFSVSAQDNSPNSIEFNNDGTKMYVLGGSFDNVYEYWLGTAFDISSASFATSFSVGNEDAIPSDIEFNNIGTKMFIVGNSGGIINEYILNTAFDISTSYFSNSYAVSAEESQPQAITFNTDGTKMYVAGFEGQDINEYDLSSPFEIITATFSNNFNSISDVFGASDFIFNHNGTKLFAIGSSGPNIYEYTLTSPFDLSTSVLSTSYFIGSEDSSPRSLTFNNSFTRLFVVGSTYDIVIDYDLNTYAFSESEANDGSVEGDLIVRIRNGEFVNPGGTITSPTHYSIDNLPGGLTTTATVGTKGKTATVTLAGNASSHESADDVNNLQFSFTDDAFAGSLAADVLNSTGPANSNLGLDFKDETIPLLTYATSIDLSTAVFSGTTFSVSLQETIPTDVVFNNDGTKMFVVGFDMDNVNEYQLTKAFDVNTATFNSSLSVASRHTFPTGLAFNTDGSKMYIVGAEIDAVSEYLLSTPFDITTAYYFSSFSVNQDDDVPLSLAFSNDGTQMFIVGNITKKVIQYSLSSPWDISSASFFSTYSVISEDTQPSGLAFNNNGTKMFITGGDNRSVYAYSLSSPFDISTSNFLSSKSVAPQESAPRNLVFNNSGTRMYIAGDEGDDITVYDLDSIAFKEDTLNNGAVNGLIIIKIYEDTLTNPGDTLFSPSHFSIDNLPDGLTPVMTVSQDGLSATLKLRDKSVFHDDSDDVKDLNFTFEDAAFTSFPASAVINATGPASSGLGIDFELNVLPRVYDQQISFCEDTQGGGVASGVDLTTFEDNVTGNDQVLSVSWYEDINLSTSINNPSDVSISDGEEFYAYVTDTITGLSDTAMVSCTIYTLPPVTSKDLTVCEDTAGTATALNIDLNSYKPDIILDESDIMVSWFEDSVLSSSVEDETNVMITDGQIFYAVIEDTLTRCTNQAELQFMVSAIPEFIKEPTDKKAFEDQSVTFSVELSDDLISIQWQADLGGGFSDISDSNIFLGTDSTFLVVLDPVGLDGVKFRAVADDNSGCKAYSYPAELEIINNNAPTAINLSNNTLPGNRSPGTIVGVFETEDPDNPVDTHTYAFVEGEGDQNNSSFQIDKNQLQSAEVLETGNQLSIRVKSEDARGLSIEESFDISVAEAGAGSPVDIELTSNEVKINSPIGTTIGFLIAIDPDTVDTHLFSVVSVNGIEEEGTFITDGSELRVGKMLDQAVETYTVLIKVVDKDQNEFVKSFDMDIKSANENLKPYKIEISKNRIDENLPANTEVGELYALDNDDTVHTFHLVEGFGDTYNQRFEISGRKLLTVSIIGITLPADTVHSIRVEADDGFGGILQYRLKIYINDKTPPSVNYDELPVEFNSDQDSVRVTLLASDNIAVRDVIFYQKGIFENDESYTKTETNALSSETYAAWIRKSSLDNYGAEFYFSVTDVSGFSALTENAFIYKKLLAGDAPKIPGLQSNGTLESYEIISIPYELSDPRISAVFEENLGPYDKTKWRILTYNNSSDTYLEYKEGLESIELGKGYWFNATESTQNIVIGESKVAKVSRTAPFNLDLKRGWNLIGNPFDGTLNWNKVKEDNPGIEINMPVGYNPGTKGTYSDISQISSWRGAWLFADDQMSIAVSPMHIDPSGRKADDKEWNVMEGSDLDSINWFVKINLENDQFRNEINGIGMNEHARLGKDKYDQINIPQFTKLPEMEILHSEYFASSFCRDVIPSTENYTWEFKIKSDPSDQFIRMYWNNKKMGTGHHALYLLDMDEQELINMKVTDEYVLDMKGSNRFEIHYGKAGTLENLFPTLVTLGNIYPNPIREKTIIPVTIPYSESSYWVTLRITDLMGRLVAIPYDDYLPPGFHKIEWNSNQILANHHISGVYICHMILEKEGTLQRESQKLIIK